MKRIREVLRRHPLATAAGAVVLVAVIGWGVYQGGVGIAPPARHPVAPPQPPPASPAAPHVPSPTETGSPTGRPGEESHAASSPAPETKADAPLPAPVRTEPGLSAGGPRGTPPAVPPVPPVSPEGSALALPPRGTVGALRLVGILESGEALAILESDTSAYVVQPGDEIEPETQVVQIDLAHERVEIQRHGVREELTLLRAGRI